MGAAAAAWLHSGAPGPSYIPSPAPSLCLFHFAFLPKRTISFKQQARHGLTNFHALPHCLLLSYALK